MTPAFAGLPLAAADQPASSGGSSPVFLILIVVLAIVWIFMLRSNKRRKQTEMAKRDAIQPGSRVMLSGGLIGTLVSRTGDRADVELGPGVTVQVMSGGILRTVDDPAPDQDDADQTVSTDEVDDVDDLDEDSTEPVDRSPDQTVSTDDVDDVDDEDSTEPVDRDDEDGTSQAGPTVDSAVTENGRRGQHD